MSDMSRNIEGKEAEEILDSILADYELDRTIDKMEDFYDQPNKEVIIDIIEKLLKIIYPGYYRDRAYKSYHANHHLSTLIEDVLYRLSRQIAKVSKFCPKLDGKCREQIEKESYEITRTVFTGSVCAVPKQSLKNMAAGSSTTVKTVLLLRNFWCQPSSNLQFVHRQKHLVHKFIIVQLRVLA